MANYTILGLGMMGEAICFDLLQFAQKPLTINLIDISKKRLENLKLKYQDKSQFLNFYQLSLLEDDDKIKEILFETDVAFGAIDYKFNLLLSKLCVDTQTNFLDLGGNPEVVLSQFELNEQAKSQNVTIIPDCGLAPGMVNVLASGLIRSFVEVEECHIRVGGLPQIPTGILKYQQVFSIRGLTNEYKEDAFVIRGGKISRIKSMTELETLYFPEPFGEMEAFQTAGGTSSLPSIYEGKIKELTYKTIRYPGHMQFFRFLLDFDLLSEDKVGDKTIREVVERKLVEFLPRNEPDVVLIRIFVLGKNENNVLISKHWQSIDYADQKNNISAMGRTTAFPISIIGQLIADGKIETKGVVPGETTVPFDLFVDELKKRNILFEETTSSLS